MTFKRTTMRAFLRAIAGLVAGMRQLAVTRCRVLLASTVAVVAIWKEARFVLAIRASPRTLIFQRCFSPLRSAFQMQEIVAVATVPDLFVMFHLFQANAAFQQVLLNLPAEDLVLVFVHFCLVSFRNQLTKIDNSIFR